MYPSTHNDPSLAFYLLAICKLLEENSLYSKLIIFAGWKEVRKLALIREWKAKILWSDPMQKFESVAFSFEFKL